MNKKIEILKNRSIISISGDDKTTFLQGLITNDINKVSENQAIYSFMLSPQGRFLYDFFIIKEGEKLLLDCNSEKIDELVQKFSFFKFRSKIEIQKELDLSVAVSAEKFADEKIAFIDPRSKEMGYRAFVSGALENENSQYDLRRINLKIPDDSDLTFDKSFPLEFGFEDLNAVDYKKGCYVGQETTARMHYKGTIRKKIFLVEIEDQNIKKGCEIEACDKKIGEVLSSILYQDKLLALALIKNLDNDGNEINLKSLKLSPIMVINS